jgi:hypothetical protein
MANDLLDPVLCDLHVLGPSVAFWIVGNLLGRQRISQQSSLYARYSRYRA